MKRRPLRAWGFRLAAIGAGMAPFIVLEVVLAALGVGAPADREDPFAGFRSVQPLFVRDATGTRWEVAPGRQRFFAPESFAVEKAPDEFRVFCLGGSTVQGRPWSIETSFTTWLEHSLTAADPSVRWEVVNCGGISYASYRIVALLDEVLGHEPDLIVVCTGHNEFLEARTYEHLVRLPEVVARPLEWIARTRTFGLVYSACCDPKPEGRPILAGDVAAQLDLHGGLERYRRDDVWQRDVVAHFEHSLERTVDRARASGVPLILVDPVGNLRDCPPFKSQHRDGLTAAGLRRFDELRKAALDSFGDDTPRALELLHEALAIDDRFAVLHWEIGRCHQSLGDAQAARSAYLAAKDLDVCPLRATEAIHEATHSVARATSTPLVDLRAAIGARSEFGIPGDDWLVDHVHPTIAGHRKIAVWLTEAIAEVGLVAIGESWPLERERRFREHLGSLGAIYFARGERDLEALRSWTRSKLERAK